MQISRRRLLVVASTASFVGFSGFSLQALAAELTLPSVGADKKFSAVPVPADPKRLAVLEYSVIENLQVLGLSDRIKAAVQTRNLPWLSALSTDCKLVKSVKSVDIETVSSAKPDLIFISGRISRNIDAFKPIAPTVCLIPNKAEGWKSFRGNFLALAEVFGKKADAEKQLKPLEKRLSALRNKAAGERIAVIMMVNGRMMAAPAGGATSEQTSASPTSSLSPLSPLRPARRRLRERNPLCPHQRKSLPATQRRSLNWQHSSRTVSLCSIRMKRSACPNPIRSRRPWPISLNGQSSMPSRAIEFMSSRMPLGTLPTAASFRWTRCSLTLNAPSVCNGSY